MLDLIYFCSNANETGLSNDIVSTKIYDKRDDFDFEMVNIPF